jgi:hypothetical protein
MEAHRPEPEESWQDRQFDEHHRQVLDLFAVINCAKCGTEGVGYGVYGELCKDCDHLMRLDAMEHCL